MIYEVEVYHEFRMGSYSDFFLVEAEDDEQAKDRVMNYSGVKNDKRIFRKHLSARELDLSVPAWLWSNER